MAAPSSTKWSPIHGSGNKQDRLGIYFSLSNSATETTVNVELWYWTRYAVSDTNNDFYYDWDSYANTSLGSKNIQHSSNSSWSTSNQTKIGSFSKKFPRGISNSTQYFSGRVTGVDFIGGSISYYVPITIPARNKYTVSYNANGGSGAPSSQSKWYGYDLTLSGAKPYREGYNFTGWSTSKDNSVEYGSGSVYRENRSITLYAVWERITFNVTFEAEINGGTVEGQKSITKVYGYGDILGELPVAVKNNHKFIGWCERADGQGLFVAYDTKVFDAVTLSAVFELQANCYIKQDGVYKAGMMYIKERGEYKTGILSVKEDGIYKETNM